MLVQYKVTYKTFEITEVSESKSFDDLSSAEKQFKKYCKQAKGKLVYSIKGDERYDVNLRKKTYRDNFNATSIVLSKGLVY